ncbi:trifunctional dihydropteroate synthetase [Aspergillus fumigatus]
MYVLDQDPFMNGVCEVETSLGPLELLDKLQSIELALGRRKLIDKGPRSIDLDILLYDQEVFSHERLNIPHKLMLERDFVLRPLCQ